VRVGPPPKRIRIVHKDYGSGIPIQISVYEHQIVVWNPGQLPQDWTLERLLGKHPSTPYNPLIANAFFRTGYKLKRGRMSTKELIQAELDTLSDEDLEALYALIKQFIQSKRPAKPRSLMATLRDIQIDAPPDFAANLDLYVSREKRAEPDLH